MTDNLHQEFLRACRMDFANVPKVTAKVLLVGEDNPLSIAPEHALYCAPEGCSGQRLQSDILALHRATYLALWRTNLCVGGWSMKRARERVAALTSEHAPWDTIVMLGRKVAQAFAYAKPPFTSGALITAPRTFALVSLPHPSGRNTLWNDYRRALEARALLREIAPEIPWGIADSHTKSALEAA